jgi:hypothetical protein
MSMTPHAIAEPAMQIPRRRPLGLLLSSFALLFLLGACATQGPRERDALRLEQFMEAAGPPIDSFQFVRMHRWQGLGPDTVAVWTRMNQLYLVRVEQPCFGLEFARSIALTSSVGRVSRRFDAVLFEDQRCRIEEIRPVDHDRLRLMQRAG